MVNFKILLAGKVNAGKTTFIKQISDFEPVTVDEMPTDINELKLKEGKATTVGLDYGAIAVDEGITLHLFGTPGQERFDFVWEVLSKGALGVILLVDSTNEDSLNDASKLVEYYTNLKLPIIVGITKLESSNAKPLEYVLQKLSSIKNIIMPFNTFNKEEVKILLLTLLNLVMESTEGDIQTMQ